MNTMTSLQSEISKAIGAHGMWKGMLRTAIETGKFDKPVEIVCQDNQCAFGRWLYSLDADTRRGPRCQRVRTLHAEFHREAARVLELALAGRKGEADREMAFGGRFANSSAALTAEMMKWKTEAT